MASNVAGRRLREKTATPDADESDNNRQRSIDRVSYKPAGIHLHLLVVVVRTHFTHFYFKLQPSLC
jgi:hypothetical protein